MENIWSTNKYVNITIDILLFLLGINFMHYAQLVVPIICLIIFIDNKCRFHVNNIKTFIILCLFGISFLIFAFSQGAFAFIGLFLPMAYYIGSNVYEPSEEKVKQIIYIFALGMTMHLVLNFATDLIIRGIEIFTRNSHLDIWTLDEYPTTQTAVNYIFILGIIYYMYVNENNKNIKAVFSILLALILVYEIALGRRTPLLILFVSLFLSIVIGWVFGTKTKVLKEFLFYTILFILLVVALGLLYYYFLYDPWKWRTSLSIFTKLFFFGIKTSRLSIYVNAIKIAPKYLWGGLELSNALGNNIHDLWMDTYDWAGVIPYILLVVYSIVSLVNMIKAFKNKNLSKEFRLLIFVLFICISMQMFLEPVISGSTIFLLSSIIVFASIECLNSKKV